MAHLSGWLSACRRATGSQTWGAANLHPGLFCHKLARCGDRTGPPCGDLRHISSARVNGRSTAPSVCPNYLAIALSVLQKGPRLPAAGTQPDQDSGAPPLQQPTADAQGLPLPERVRGRAHTARPIPQGPWRPQNANWLRCRLPAALAIPIDKAHASLHRLARARDASRATALPTRRHRRRLPAAFLQPLLRSAPAPLGCRRPHLRWPRLNLHPPLCGAGLQP